MAEVKLPIGGRSYVVTCQDGEEDHLKSLGLMVAEKVENAANIASGLSESRLFLFASLLLADELSEMRNQVRDGAAEQSDANQNGVQAQAAIAGVLENLAGRIETLASSLENKSPSY